MEPGKDDPQLQRNSPR